MDIFLIIFFQWFYYNSKIDQYNKRIIMSDIFDYKRKQPNAFKLLY